MEGIERTSGALTGPNVLNVCGFGMDAGRRACMWKARWYRRWLVGSLQAFLFILVIEDHARLKTIFKYEIMKRDFKLADTSLMREVELLQQSATFLFGAGVVAGFTAGASRSSTTQQQDHKPFFEPSIWAIWGVIAACLLCTVLAAFFARMMASMLWSLSKDYLDRLTPVYDQMYPGDAKLAGVLAAWDAKMVKIRNKAQPGKDCVAAAPRVAPTADEATSQPSPVLQPGADSDVISTAPAVDSVGHAKDQGLAAAGSPEITSVISPASSPAPTALNKKLQVKQLVYWNALSPALLPGVNTVWVFIALGKICFLSAATLWSVVFLLIAHSRAANNSSLWTVVAVTLFTVVVMDVVVFCMVRYVFAVFRGYHEPNGAFWPARWDTTFTFNMVPQRSNTAARWWDRLRLSGGSQDTQFELMHSPAASSPRANAAEHAAGGHFAGHGMA